MHVPHKTAAAVVLTRAAGMCSSDDSHTFLTTRSSCTFLIQAAEGACVFDTRVSYMLLTNCSNIFVVETANTLLLVFCLCENC